MAKDSVKYFSQQQMQTLACLLYPGHVSDDANRKRVADGMLMLNRAIVLAPRSRLNPTVKQGLRNFASLMGGSEQVTHWEGSVLPRKPVVADPRLDGATAIFAEVISNSWVKVAVLKAVLKREGTEMGDQLAKRAAYYEFLESVRWSLYQPRESPIPALDLAETFAPEAGSEVSL